jgi:hypothetical protein
MKLDIERAVCLDKKINLPRSNIWVSRSSSVYLVDYIPWERLVPDMYRLAEMNFFLSMDLVV